MRIRFKKIRWKNFLSTGEEGIEFNLDREKMMLFIGKNGAGKSTILDALSFVNFNKPFREINKPQLINSISRKNCLVEEWFEVGGHEYYIKRGMKPNVFEVYKDGELINQDAKSTDYQEHLEKRILKMNHKAFCQIIGLGSANHVPFMKLKPGPRREVIEEILDLHIIGKMNSVLKQRRETVIDAVKDSHRELEAIRRELDILRRHGSAVTDDTEAIIAEKQSRIEDTLERISRKNAEIETLKASLAPLLENLRESYEANKNLRELVNLRSKITGAVENLERNKNFFIQNAECPTCKQGITDDHKNTMIVDFDLKMTERNHGLVQIGEKITVAEERVTWLSSIERRVSELKLDIRSIENEIQAWNSYVSETLSDIEKMKKTTKRTPEWASLEKELEKRLETEAEKYNSLEDERELIEAANALLKDEGMKAHVVKQYIPIINGLINKYLAALDFFVAFELDENFNETIKSRHRDEFSYNSFSEGQKFRINLAMLFTWRAIAQMRNSVSTNLMIMDEVMDSSLDSEGTEEFLKIMRNTLTNDTNVVIISHKVDQLVDRFDKVVHFKLHKNFTTTEG